MTVTPNRADDFDWDHYEARVVLLDHLEDGPHCEKDLIANLRPYAPPVALRQALQRLIDAGLVERHQVGRVSWVHVTDPSLIWTPEELARIKARHESAEAEAANRASVLLRDRLARGPQPAADVIAAAAEAKIELAALHRATRRLQVTWTDDGAGRLWTLPTWPWSLAAENGTTLARPSDMDSEYPPELTAIVALLGNKWSPQGDYKVTRQWTVGYHGLLVITSGPLTSREADCQTHLVQVNLRTHSIDHQTWFCQRIHEPHCGEKKLHEIAYEPARHWFPKHPLIHITAFPPEDAGRMRQARLRAHAATLTLPLGERTIDAWSTEGNEQTTVQSRLLVQFADRPYGEQVYGRRRDPVPWVAVPPLAALDFLVQHVLIVPYVTQARRLWTPGEAGWRHFSKQRTSARTRTYPEEEAEGTPGQQPDDVVTVKVPKPFTAEAEVVPEFVELRWRPMLLRLR